MVDSSQKTVCELLDHLKNKTSRVLISLKEAINQDNVDTIDQLLNEHQSLFHINNVVEENKECINVFDIKNTPNLFFTKVIAANIGTEPPKHWANLVRSILEEACHRGLTVNDIMNISDINVRQDEYRSDGYQYIPKLCLSFQEMDANKSWENVHKIAKVLKIELIVIIEWQHGGIFPGGKGILYFRPNY